MAYFGYERVAGRRYRNIATGEVISRRQFDKEVARQISEYVSDETVLGAEAMTDAAQRMADIEEAMRRREVAQRPEVQRALTSGLKRKNAALEAYYDSERMRGSRLTKREMEQSDDFKSIMRDFKGRPNPDEDEDIADDNAFRRRKALDRMGGDKKFRREYERLYGGRAGGHGQPRPRRRDSKGNPTNRRRTPRKKSAPRKSSRKRA